VLQKTCPPFYFWISLVKINRFYWLLVCELWNPEKIWHQKLINFLAVFFASLIFFTGTTPHIDRISVPYDVFQLAYVEAHSHRRHPTKLNWTNSVQSRRCEHVFSVTGWLMMQMRTPPVTTASPGRRLPVLRDLLSRVAIGRRRYRWIRSRSRPAVALPPSSNLLSNSRWCSTFSA